MGLDMYLYAKEYISGVDFKNDKERGFYKEANPRFQTILETVGLTMDDVEPELPSIHIQFKVLQWRKANAIHQWFVDNVQDGEDDCKSYYVGTDQLEELRGTIGQALAIRDGSDDTGNTVEDILPTQSGFFFGSTDYDEWYWKELEFTYEAIDKILNNPRLENYEFEYTSSW